jgi:hypothetical protein
MPATTDVTVVASPFRYLEWGPIFLGALGAAAISVVLITFGSALGLSAVSPYPYRGVSATTFFIIAGLFAALVQVTSFAAGGYLAGRMRSPWAGGTEGERHFRDGAHGFAVWALGIVFGAAILTSGAAGALKTATEATATVSAGAAMGAAQGAANRLSLEPVDYATDFLLRPAAAPAGAPAAAPATAPQPAGAGAPPAAGMAGPDPAMDRAPIARAFTASLKGGQMAPRDRTYLAQVVARQTGMSQADAEKRVDEAYAEAKAAEKKARDAANEARKKGILVAFLTAATLIIACAAACVAAGLGAKDRDLRTGPYWMGAPRFW